MKPRDPFAAAVMNWISEATAHMVFHREDPRSILGDACGRCWAEYKRGNHIPDAGKMEETPTNHDAAPTARVSGSQCAGHADIGGTTAECGVTATRGAHNPKTPGSIPGTPTCNGDSPSVEALLDDIQAVLNQIDPWMGSICVVAVNTPEARKARKSLRTLKEMLCKRTKVGVPDTGSGAGSTPVAQQCQPFDSAPTTLDAQPGAKAEPSERGTRREGQGTGDICERLRGWFKAVDAVPATDLMDEAADEIERLRNGALSGCETVQQEPVAWARYDAEGGFRNVYTPNEYEGGRIAWEGWGCTFVPLYRSPTLTDDERQAVEDAATELTPGPIADKLRSLLRRLGGSNG